ncbi:hypothetical protein HAX54_034589 [Datura stramonium]|uniref:Uncharacterized protein n=1 Tax=Datura stramonium TaxID=4076 RepID=A0ABS8VEZ4_DATST|nr:hypothetical protein [Datura stramonium]
MNPNWQSPEDYYVPTNIFPLSDDLGYLQAPINYHYVSRYIGEPYLWDDDYNQQPTGTFLIKLVARPTCMRPDYSSKLTGYVSISQGMVVKHIFCGVCNHKSAKRMNMGAVNTSENKVVVVGQKNLSSMDSAQDCLRWKRRNMMILSPRGVIEVCIRNQENDSNYPKAKPSGSQRCLSNPSDVKKENQKREENVAMCLYPFKSSRKNFSLSDLKNATNNFSWHHSPGQVG